MNSVLIPTQDDIFSSFFFSSKYKILTGKNERQRNKKIRRYSAVNRFVKSSKLTGDTKAAQNAEDD